VHYECALCALTLAGSDAATRHELEQAMAVMQRAARREQHDRASATARAYAKRQKGASRC
jgi:hypothetical protein